MIEWYKRKLLQRLVSAWPEHSYQPIDVDDIDTRTWNVLYQHPDTQERVSICLLKSELRRQEKYHEALSPSPFRIAETVDAPPTPDPVVLAFNPDTAYYTIRPANDSFQPIKRELAEELQEELEALKQLAQEEDDFIPTRWIFEGAHLLMRDKGGSQFKWIMESKKLIVSIGRGKKTGIIGQVRLSSEYLWGYRGDYGRALSNVHVFLTTIFGQAFILEQSGLDLAADVLFFDLSATNVKEHFISRAVLDDERPVEIDDGFVDGPSSIKRRWKRLSGLAFGLHTSPVSAVIYNKTHEIKYHSPEKKWFHDIWRARCEELGIEYSEDMIVMRVEIRFTRPVFLEFPDVSGAYEVLPRLRDLWTYGIGHPGGGKDGLPDGWLRFIVPSQDSNRARWPIHPAWEVIQHAYEEPALPVSPYAQELAEQETMQKEADAFLELSPFTRSKYALDEPISSDAPLLEHLQEEEAALAALQAEQLKKLNALLDLKPFIRMRRREVNMDRMIAQIAGCMATLEAWRRNYEQDDPNPVKHDLLTTTFVILHEVNNRYEEKAIDFNELVEEKQVLYGMKKLAI